MKKNIGCELNEESTLLVSDSLTFREKKKKKRKKKKEEEEEEPNRDVSILINFIVERQTRFRPVVRLTVVSIYVR